MKKNRISTKNHKNQSNKVKQPKKTIKNIIINYKKQKSQQNYKNSNMIEGEEEV